MFMPGIPQVWYLDIFAGKNNYAAADKGGSGGHKEINRTTLTNTDIKNGLKSDIVLNQLKIMRLRNTLKAFSGKIDVKNNIDEKLSIKWKKEESEAHLEANLKTFAFSISYFDEGNNQKLDF